MFSACSSTLAPNGMSWDEYHAARFALKIVYQEAEIDGCRELGVVQGSAFDDVGTAKDLAAGRAVELGADTLLIDKLWSDFNPFRLRRQPEIYYAEGRAYRCQE